MEDEESIAEHEERPQFYVLGLTNKIVSDWDTISEDSYAPTFSTSQVERNIILLAFNPLWFFTICVCNCFTFFTEMYRIVYKSKNNSRILLISRISCITLLALDSGLIIIHKLSKNMHKKTPYKPNNYAYIVLNVLTTLLLIIDTSVNLTSIDILCPILVIIRTCLNVYQYNMFLVCNTEIRSIVILSKFALILYIVIIFCAWLWMFIYQNMRSSKYTWMEQYTIKYLREVNGFLSAFDNYIICVFYSMGAFCNMGYGGASVRNNVEQLIMMIQPILGTFLVKGSLLGRMVVLKYDEYKVYSKFLYHNILLAKHMVNNKLPAELNKLIKLSFVKTLGRSLGKDETELFINLPQCLQSQVYLDKYWFALNKSFLFNGAPEGLKRLVAQSMTTLTYSAGETIFEVGYQYMMMFFIVRGSVHIISPEDGESVVLTLGVGSCIGSQNLILSRTITHKIESTTYTVVQALMKEALWRIPEMNCVESGYSTVLHNNLKAKLELSRRRRELEKQVVLEKVLKRIPLEVDLWNNFGDSYEDKPYLRSTKINESSNFVFLKTTWPWVLYPQSEFIIYWEFFLFGIICIVAVVHPYYLSFGWTMDTHYVIRMFTVFVSVVYIVDVILILMTAVQHDDGLERSPGKIALLRMKSMSFIIDIMAAIPFVMLCFFIYDLEPRDRWNIFPILQFNILLKVVKIPLYLKKLENFYKLDMIIMRIIKYVFFLTFTSYIMASIYYKIFCDTTTHTCTEHSFFGIVWYRLNRPRLFAYFYYYALSILTCSRLVGLYSMKELYLIIVATIIAIYMFISINSDFLATLCVIDSKKDEYESMMEGMQMYMNYCQMKEATQFRIHNFLTLQWVHFNGVDENTFFNDISKVLNNKINCYRFLTILDSVPLFHGLEPEVLNAVAEHCHVYFLPPEEFVVYEGQIVADFFIIEKGYCEVICSISRRVIKILEPKGSFCLLEMLLNKPSPYSYRAKTHVSVIKINKDILYKKVFYMYTELKDQIRSTAKYIGNSTMVERVFTRKPGLLEYERMESVSYYNTSWFVFPKNKRHPLYIDYCDELKRGNGRFFWEYLLMRRTVLPGGRFITVYSILDRILIFISVYYCLLMQFYRSYWDPIFHLSLILDVLGFLDMYLHFHFCYYNNKGILVSHPKRTAMNYLKTNFVIDFLSVMPFEKLIEFKRSNYTKTSEIMITFNRALKLYRFRVEDNSKPFVKTSFVIKVMNVVLMLLLILHGLSVVLLLNSTDIKKDGQNIVVSVTPGSWLSDQRSILEYRGNPTFLMHINCFYWITLNTITGPVAMERDFHGILLPELLITGLCSLFGYLLFTVLLGQMSRLQSKLNAKKLEYEIYIGEYKRFMKNQKIPIKLQKSIISYFDNLWKRTLGFNPVDVVTRCHDALKEDWIARFYVPFFKKVPIFNDIAYQVAQNVGIHLEPKYYLENTVVINLNDLVDKVFIIWSGEVQIQDASKGVVEGLGEGSLFGNLDSVQCTRSMVKVVVTKPVDLLCLDTLKFYKLLADIPYVKSRLNNHLILECLSYLKSRTPVGETKSVFFDSEVDVVKPWSFTRAISSVYIEWTFLICTYLSLLCTFFIVSFSGVDIVRFGVFYTLDVIYLFQIVCDFFVRDQGAFGQVRRKKYERKWYLKHRLPYNICAIFPFELIGGLASPNQEVEYLKLNRILKLMRIVEFFKANFRRKLFVMNSLSIVSGLVLFIHSSACILHVVTSPNDEAEPWIAKPNSVGYLSEAGCETHYFCGLYYAAALFSQTAFTTFQPHSLKGRICVIFLAIIGCIVLCIFLTRMFVMVKSLTHAVIKFEYDRIQLNHFLSFSQISPQLRKNVLRYVDYLWIYSKGRQVPIYLERTPPHLKMALKSSIFGKHIFSNPVFVNCHVDFLRQLAGRFRIEVYFKNDLICQQGTINQTMYFIHIGRVRVLEADEMESAQIDELCAPDCFGLIQGLFPCSAHNYTFEAVEITTIVSLTLQDWRKLMIFFPAAALAIYKNFSELLRK